MQFTGQETCPLPEHPVLAEVASTFNQAGAWCKVYDGEYRLVYMTDEGRLTYGGLVEMVPVPLGAYIFGPEYIDAMLSWPGAGWGIDAARGLLTALGPWAIADAPGGRDEVREMVDPRLRDMVDVLAPAEDSTAKVFAISGSSMGVKVQFDVTHQAMRIRDQSGRFVGVVTQLLTAVGMSTIGAIAAIGDLRHFERMQRV